MFRRQFFFAFAATFVLASAVAAQDHANHGGGAAALPAICTANAPAQPAVDETMTPSTPAPDEAHAALAASMDPMHAGMAIGMTAEDIDVAFVCSMIPHHQGAIDMARAELTYGKDPWAREMAKTVIDAQEAEIVEMLAWLEERSR